MNLTAAVADARARRAHLIDRLSMNDPAAACAACRARGIMLGVALLAGTAWYVTHRRKARP